MRSFTYLFRLSLSIALLFGLALHASAQELCGGPLERNNFQRPLNYNDRLTEANNLNLVEMAHFSSKVEALREGDTSPLPMDIDYVLRQIPNHYRALNSMANFQLTHPRPRDAHYYTVECYFERAFAFHPEDPNLFLIYAIYLHKKKDYDQALSIYKHAESLGSQSAELYYNLGLLYLDRNELKSAKEYADKAYALGYPLSGLRTRLQKANTK